ncbi:MAG: tRNA epoxyqueuosine(34) reductase QueG [Clostridium sp.]|jgi:epoxyqueuosine reductase|uniref:tRNA epoxyqueuosine(34) reductase QueG n=1 Tax=Clostridium sp. TaxID=1506 RepID=UPI0025BBC78C|nr:tRNA epoxyqueuosine(34) reductase QueG [Clostridium sp.]MCH3965221.1 tRNA epoxyqueuosine(34) reductase QueG [Clostridium sp.]MCI1714441.1 tRNA epoxyqueuosine(34) reductase QueG [Clostridium sp.]MCI1798703.1 tRNA epoxyqueuosine(34) reductase QueG [Clostridium sp.]MCI1812566.1 tRNA epoxyqueuosine(34) reductase QueG [Clostridium sp.]MCI1869513.1 tRNA epoxyqueuosine(34) reductase QueG [Clostridium sp.]
MTVRDSIVDYCNSIGLDTVGFIECRIFYELYDYFHYRNLKLISNEFEEKDEKKRIDPCIYMKGGKTIISVAFPYLFPKIYKSDIGFSFYTMGEDYHGVVLKYLNMICSFIESIGGRAVALVDSNALPERYIAKLAGIGFIGKNNTLITPKYGSYVFLGEVITDIDIDADVDNILNCGCGSCDLCLKACPTKAISRNNYNICMSYITQKKSIDDEWFFKFQGRLFGCDVCQNVCPYNKNMHFSHIPEFKPFDFMEHINLNEIINMDNKIFRQKYGRTSCGWRGKNIIIRNGLINAFTLSKEIEIKNMRSPYVKYYYDRLLQLFNL